MDIEHKLKGNEKIVKLNPIKYNQKVVHGCEEITIFKSS